MSQYLYINNGSNYYVECSSVFQFTGLVFQPHFQLQQALIFSQKAEVYPLNTLSPAPHDRQTKLATN